MRRLITFGLAVALACAASTKLIVTVMDPKTGRFAADVKAEEVTVFDDKTPKRVEGLEIQTGPVDAMLLLDTSLMGEMVQPVAAELIKQLGDKDQMAVVAYHSSADLIQDFTGSKDRLMRAVAGVKYGNTPRVLDALYAAIDGGFENTTYRRVILLVTAGLTGYGKVGEKEVIRLARKNGVSIFALYVSGQERSMFETLARQTGGGVFNLRDLRKNEKDPFPGVFETIRKSYVVTVSGQVRSEEKLKVEVKRPGKVFVSALVVE